MILQNKHLEKALNQLESAYDSVPGDNHEYEDHSIACAIVERALSEALRTKPELLPFVGEPEIADLERPLKAQVGRLLFVRAQLLDELNHGDLAVHSHRLACQAFRDCLGHIFDDDDRYVANHLHQLLRHPLSTRALSTREAGVIYTQLFDFYADQDLLDRAEDMLFHALDLLADPPDLLQAGIDFYDRQLQRPTVELQRRGLPRHEVRASRRELLDRSS